MTDDYIWQQIAALLSRAAERVILVAPFIKKEIFQAALDVIPASVSEIRCITRWSVAEIAAGVSDPEIADLAAGDGRASILLCHSLHAKAYISDDRCLVGSANLTGKATGLQPSPNLEILLEVPSDHPEVLRLIRAAEASSVPGTPELARIMREQANSLLADEDGPRLIMPSEATQPIYWMPETRRPSRLYGVYSGRHVDIGDDVLAGVLRDLTVLDIPPGLDEQTFRREVLTRLKALPHIHRLYIDGNLNLGDLQRTLESSGEYTSTQAQRSTETIAEWLRYFDDVYVVPIGSWEIRRGKEIV